MNKNENVEEVAIKTLPIKLGQFLKMANAIQDGFEAKIHIQSGVVQVNGVIETQRGKQLLKDDIVSFDENNYKVCLES